MWKIQISNTCIYKYIYIYIYIFVCIYTYTKIYIYTCVCVYIYIFFNRAAPAAYGSFRARGQIGAVVACSCHSHSNAGSEPHLRPIPQIEATPDP